jgi:hypothetical protein
MENGNWKMENGRRRGRVLTQRTQRKSTENTEQTKKKRAERRDAEGAEKSSEKSTARNGCATGRD